MAGDVMFRKSGRCGGGGGGEDEEEEEEVIYSKLTVNAA